MLLAYHFVPSGLRALISGHVQRMGSRMETNSLPMNTTDRLIGQQKSGQSATFAYDNNSNLTTKWHQGGNPQTMQYFSFLGAGSAADRLTLIAKFSTPPRPSPNLGREFPVTR